MKKRELNKQASINKICAGFFKLIQTKQLNEISMTDIANQTNVKRSTIYGYFKSVNDISNYLLDLNNKYCETYIEEYFDFLNNEEFITKVHVKEALTPLVEKISEQPDHYFLLKKLDFTYLPILEVIRTLITRIVKQTNPDAEPVEYYECAVKYGIYGIILQWLKNGAAEPVNYIVDFLIKILFMKFEY